MIKLDNLTAEQVIRKFFYILATLALLGTFLVDAETKLEIDLKAKLAASETARAAALREKADLAAVVLRLSKTADAIQSGSQTASQSAGIAQKDAGLAQDSATALALITQQAATLAASAALIAQEQAAKSNSNSRDMIWAQVVILLGLFGGFANSAMRENRRHKWALQEAKENLDRAERNEERSERTDKNIAKLEKNTNSMVEIMRESATKEGRQEGFDAGVASVSADKDENLK